MGTVWRARQAGQLSFGERWSNSWSVGGIDGVVGGRVSRLKP